MTLHLIGQPANAEDCSLQTARYQSCEAVLDSADLAVKRQAETIAALSDQNAALKKALDTATPIVNAPEPAWYESKYLWFAFGVGAGAYLGSR